MDPVSAIGLAGSALGIIDIVTRSVQTLQNLQKIYKDADLTVSLLIGQLSTLKAALCQISEWINTTLVNAPQHHQLVADLTISLDCCERLIRVLNARLHELKRTDSGALSTMGKGLFAWGEKDRREFLNHLNHQTNALNLLLTTFQCRSLSDQGNILRSDESRRVFNLVKDDTSSLLWLRDAESSYSARSTVAENSELLDSTFDFDLELFRSKAYLVAMKSSMKHELARSTTAMQQEAHATGIITDTSDLIDSNNGDDDEDADTIREPPATSWPLREGRAVHGNTDSKICAEEDDCQVQQGLQRNKDLLPPEEDKQQGPVKLATRNPSKRLSLPKPHTTSPATPTSKSNFSNNGNPRVLILGPEKSGKSTLLKAMKLFCEGTYTLAERNAFKYIIFHNIIQSALAILDYGDYMGTSLDLLKPKTILGQLAVMEGGEQSFHVGLREVIDSLWGCFWVQLAFRRSREYELDSSCAYFFDSISRIAQPDYLPTDQDIVRCRVQTTGTSETTFTCSGIFWIVPDVSGAPIERSKWIHRFENAACLIYVADISAYDQSLREDQSVNRLTEDLTLFDSTCNSNWFTNTPIILFLNKVDLFERKFSSSFSTYYCPGYKGRTWDIEAAKEYIRFRFLARYKGSNYIHVEYTSIEGDLDLGELAFNLIKDHITQPSTAEVFPVSGPQAL
ncbi:MAG: guanine nucleotide-binding subunit alpha [Lasallia pustulata]|uniref:Guanine nucleotide-binding subunit alpha n=1 Tax=Lasallia pustulata TaxID=136370 RepID=A0A5M8PZQ3_9LECA|nr:MAG: guanine nucleotide-binding subunit alpha [Lasallia pustulata]